MRRKRDRRESPNYPDLAGVDFDALERAIDDFVSADSIDWVNESADAVRAVLGADDGFTDNLIKDDSTRGLWLGLRECCREAGNRGRWTLAVKIWCFGVSAEAFGVQNGGAMITHLSWPERHDWVAMAPTVVAAATHVDQRPLYEGVSVGGLVQMARLVVDGGPTPTDSIRR